MSFEKDDAMAAVQKLQSVIQMVQSEMAAAQEAAERYPLLPTLLHPPTLLPPVAHPSLTLPLAI